MKIYEVRIFFHYFLFIRLLSYSSHIYILPVILLAVVFNISRFSELETCTTINTTRVINISLKLYQIASEYLVKFLPIIIYYLSIIRKEGKLRNDAVLVLTSKPEDNFCLSQNLAVGLNLLPICIPVE